MSSKIKDKIASVLAEKILSELETSSKAGKKILNTARPAIVKLFAELPENRQALLMYFLKQSVKKQKASGEFDIAKLALNVSSLENVNLEMLNKMKKQIQYIHGIVASSLLVSYGGLGENRISIEG